MIRCKLFTFRISSILRITVVVACVCALLRDSPQAKIHHGSFDVSAPGELSVYEFFDESLSGFQVMPGKWRVEGNWLNYGSNFWLCDQLVVSHESYQVQHLDWDTKGHTCSVSGSMTAVFDSANVRQKSAFPISVPWSDDPFTEDMGCLGEYDEFWDMKHSLVMTDYGVILQAGHGDDGSYEFFTATNSNGDICAIRCVLEEDKSFWINRYYSTPLLARLRDRFSRILPGR